MQQYSRPGFYGVGRMNFTTRILCVFFAIAVSGCANLNSIHRDNKVSEKRGEVVFTDAKQRGIISNPVKEKIVTNTIIENGKKTEGTELELRLRMCSEAAPDVFSAFATSAAGKASVDAATKSGSGAFSFSSNETAATISRTQTVNLLREAMFRTCERYLNGAIDKDELIVQASRDQQMIVSTLAIEQLTGVYTPPVTGLNTQSGAATGGPTEEALKLVDKAKKDWETAKSNADNAETKAKAAEEAAKGIPEKHSKKNCAAVVADESLKESAKEDIEKCQKAINERELADELKKAAKAEKEHYDLLKKMAGAMGGTLAAASGSVSVAPGYRHDHCCENKGEVARTVERIVERTFRFDEAQMACVVVLRKSARYEESIGEKTRKFCFNLIMKNAEFNADYATANLSQDIALTAELAAIHGKFGDNVAAIAKCAFPSSGENNVQALVNQAITAFSPGPGIISVYQDVGEARNAEEVQDALIETDDIADAIASIARNNCPNGE